MLFTDSVDNLLKNKFIAAVKENNHDTVQQILQLISDTCNAINATTDVILAEIFPFVNAQDETGSPVLVIAADRGYSEIVATLVKNRANLEAICPVLGTPLLAAVYIATENFNKMDFTKSNAYFPIIDTLLNAHANVHARSTTGKTVLHYAVHNKLNNPKLLTKLLLAGANPGPEDTEKNIPTKYKSPEELSHRLGQQKISSILRFVTSLRNQQNPITETRFAEQLDLLIAILGDRKITQDDMFDEFKQFVPPAIVSTYPGNDALLPVTTTYPQFMEMLTQPCLPTENQDEFTSATDDNNYDVSLLTGDNFTLPKTPNINAETDLSTIVATFINAVKANNTDLVTQLLATYIGDEVKSLLVNAVDENNTPLLVFAADQGNEKMVALLTKDKMATLEAPCPEKGTPLLAAVFNADTAYKKYMAAPNDDELKQKSQAYDAIVAQLLASSANPNAQSKTQNTALHYLFQLSKTTPYIHQALFNLLLEYGANPLIKNSRASSVVDEVQRFLVQNQIINYAIRTSIYGCVTKASAKFQPALNPPLVPGKPLASMPLNTFFPAFPASGAPYLPLNIQNNAQSTPIVSNLTHPALQSYSSVFIRPPNLLNLQPTTTTSSTATQPSSTNKPGEEETSSKKAKKNASLAKKKVGENSEKQAGQASKKRKATTAPSNETTAPKTTEATTPLRRSKRFQM